MHINVNNGQLNMALYTEKDFNNENFPITANDLFTTETQPNNYNTYLVESLVRVCD